MKNCENCKARNVCVARNQLLNEESDSSYRLICSTPDEHAAILHGIKSLLAENCRYFQPLEPTSKPKD